MDYFTLQLRAFLHENHPDKTDNWQLIEKRSKQANIAYAQSIENGENHLAATEIALSELYQDLRFSPYNTLFEVLAEEFSDSVPEAKIASYALELLPLCKEVFAHYSLHDDFAQSPLYPSLYAELIGKIEEYGL